MENTAIIIRQSARGHRVHPPYKNPEFIRGFKALAPNARWYAESSEWFVPNEKLDRVKELLERCFDRPVIVEGSAPPATPPPPAVNSREVMIDKIKKVWLGGPIRYDLSRWLLRHFGVNQLEMLSDQTIEVISNAIKS